MERHCETLHQAPGDSNLAPLRWPRNWAYATATVYSRDQCARGRPLRLLQSGMRRDRPSKLQRLRLVEAGEWNLVAVRASTSSGEPLVLLDQGEDDGMQHLRALFQLRMFPAETGKFLIGFARRTQAGR
jgi:hypothetical protein